MLTMFIRAMLLYIIVIAFIRGLGKRELGQLQPYELVLTILLADLAASPMSDIGVPLMYGIMPIAALILVYAVTSLLTLKSEKLRHIVTGHPSILVRNGVIDEMEMKKQGYTLSQLMEQVRESGIINLSQVGVAIMEISGRVNVFPVSQNRPLTPKDMHIQTQYEGQTLLLVLDGRVQSSILTTGGLSEEWLSAQLNKVGAKADEVFFCSLDTQGAMSVQKKGAAAVEFVQALDAKEVCW